MGIGIGKMMMTLTDRGNHRKAESAAEVFNTLLIQADRSIEPKAAG